MTERKIALDIDFGYDDTTQGLNAITHHGKQVLDVFLKMADQIALASTKMGQAGKAQIDPLTAMGRAADQVFKGVTKNLEAMEKQVRQADMSPLAKSADNFAQKIKAAEAEVAKLEKSMEKATAEGKDTAKTAQQIAEAKGQIAKMQAIENQLAQKAAQHAAEQRKAEIDQANALAKSRSDREAAAKLAEQERASKAAQAVQEREIAKARREQAQADKAAGRAQDTLDNSAIKAAENALKGVSKELTDIERKTRQADMSPLAKSADRYAEKITALKALITNLEQAIQRSSVSEEKRAQAVNTLAIAYSRLNDLTEAQARHAGLAKLRDDAKAAEKELKAAAQQTKALADAQRDLGQAAMTAASEMRNVSGALAATLGIGIGASAKSFMELNTQATTFKAVAKASDAEVARLVETSKGLEGVSTTAATKAAVALSRAGLEAKTATDQLDKFSKASIATGEELEVVADLVLATNRAYGKSNSELNKTTDIMVAAANASATSIGEVGHAMSIMGSTAANNNQTLLSTAKAFGILRDAGFSAEMAATGYKNAIQNMATPSKDMREAMDKLFQTTNATTKVFTENGKMRDFADIMKDIKKQVSGLSDVKRSNILDAMFEERDLNIVQGWLKQTDEKIAATSAEVDAFGDVTERTADVMRESMGYEFGEMLKQAKNLQIEFGDKLSPILRQFIDLLSDLIGAWDKLSSPMQSIVAGGVLVVASIATIVSGFSQLVISIGGAAFAYNTLKTAMVAHATQSAAVAAANATTATSIGAVDAAGKAAALTGGGLAVFALGLAAIVAGVAVTVKAFNDMGMALDDLDNRLKDFDAGRKPFQGALDAARKKGFQDLTDDEARSARLDTKTQAADVKSQIQAIQNTAARIKQIREELEKPGNERGPAHNDLLHELNLLEGAIVNGVKRSTGVLDAVLEKQLGSVVSIPGTGDDASEASVSRVINLLGLKLKQLETASEKLGSSKAGAPKADTPPPVTDDDLGGGESKPAKDARDFISALQTKTDKQIALDKKAIGSMKELQSTAVTTQSTVANALTQSAVEIANNMRTSGACYEGFGKALRKAEEAAGILDRNGRVIKGQTSIWADIRANEQDAAWMFNKAASRAVAKGILEEYRPQSLKDITAGTMMVLKSGWYRGNTAGHVGTLDAGGYDYSDHKDNVLLRNPGLLKDAANKFYRYTGTASGGPSKEVLEARKDELESKYAEIAIQKQLNALLEKQRQTKDPGALKALGLEIEQVQTKLTNAQTKTSEAAQRAEQKRVEGVKHAHEQIVQLEAEHQAAQIALIEDGYAQLEAQRQSDLDANDAAREKALAEFKGNEDQRQALIGQYNQREFDIQARHNKALVDLTRERARQTRQLQSEAQNGAIDLMVDGLDKELAAIEAKRAQEIANLKDAAAELLRTDKDNAAALAANRDLQRQADLAAGRDRKKAVLDNAKDTNQALFEAAKARMTAEEQAFASSLDNIAKQKKSLGMDAAGTVADLKPQDVLGLAQTLGQGNLDNTLAGLKAQKDALFDLTMAMEVEQAKYKKGSTERINIETALRGLEQQRADLALQIALIEDPALRAKLEAYQKMLPMLAKLNEEQALFQALVSGVAGTLSSIAGIFGEMGRNVASGINTVSSVISAGGTLMKNMKELGNNFDIAKLLANPESVASITSIITTAAATWIGAIASVANFWGTFEKNVLKMIDDRANYEIDQELKIARRRLDIRKQNGEDILQEELIQIERETAEKLRRLQQQQDDLKRQPWTLTMEDAAKLNQEFYDLEGQKKDVSNQGVQQAEDTKRAAAARRVQERMDLEARAMDARVVRAKLAENQDLQITEEGEQAKLAVRHKFDKLFEEATLKGVQDQSKITQAYFDELALAQAETDQKRRDMRAANAAFETAATYDHEQALLNLKEEGAMRELEQLQLNKRRRLAELDDEKLKYKANSKELARLATQRADAEKAADAEILKSQQNLARERDRYLSDTANQIKSLAAQLSKGSLDDAYASGRISLAALTQQQAEEVKRAQGLYAAGSADLQRALTQIDKRFELERAVQMKQIRQAALDAIQKEAEDKAKTALDKQLAPLQRILDAENKKLEALRLQNEERQRALDLIDEEAEKNQKAFDARDRDEFDAKVFGALSLAELTIGGNFIANEDIKNGTITDRSSKETQVRGLRGYLAEEARKLEVKLKNEGFDKTDAANNKALFDEAMSQIVVRQHRAAEEFKAYTENSEERMKLNEEQADLYVKYQELQKDAIDQRRQAARRADEALIDSNNHLIESGERTVTSTTRQIETLQKGYDDKIKAIDEAFDKLAASSIDAFGQSGSAADAMINKLDRLNPTIATQVEKALEHLKKLRDAMNAPMNIGGAAGAGSGSNADTAAHTQIDGIGPKLNKGRSKTQSDKFKLEGLNGWYYANLSDKRAGDHYEKFKPEIADSAARRAARAANKTPLTPAEQAQGVALNLLEDMLQHGGIPAIPGYADGGVPYPEGSRPSVIKGMPLGYDRGVTIRAHEGERILQAGFNRRMENMLRSFEVMPQHGPQINDFSVHFGDINNNADIDRLRQVLDTDRRRNGSKGIQNFGINGTSRN